MYNCTIQCKQYGEIRIYNWINLNIVLSQNECLNRDTFFFQVYKYS